MFLKRKLRLHSQYFPENSLTFTESSGKFSDLHSIFRLCALRYCNWLKFMRKIQRATWARLGPGSFTFSLGFSHWLSLQAQKRRLYIQYDTVWLALSRKIKARLVGNGRSLIWPKEVWILRTAFRSRYDLEFCKQSFRVGASKFNLKHWNLSMQWP